MAYDQLLKHRSRDSFGTFLVTWCTERRRPLLAIPEVARQVQAAIHDTDGLGHCRTHAHVLMPDHVHWLLSLAGNIPISTVVASAKARASSRVRMGGWIVSGSIWQPGFHEHVLRKEEGLVACARYVVANPLRAGLVERVTDYPWWYSEWDAGE